MCVPVLASIAAVYRQQLKICVVLDSEFAILSTNAALCAEHDRATSALDKEKTLPGPPACGTFGPDVRAVNLGWSYKSEDKPKAEGHQVPVPQHALAQRLERDEVV